MSTETDSREAPLLERREGRGDRRRQVVRVAAVGDFHCGEQDAGMYRAAFAKVNQEAEVLLLAGDLTRWGTPAEMRVAVGELADVTIPIVAVLGNHDYESDQVEEISCILRDRGVNLLDGDIFELNEQVGIAGVKGFIGGFGRRTLTSFGEPETKRLVTATQEEVKKLELALRRLAQPVRIVLLHYAPIVDTVLGEPEQIFAFLGTDRLAEPIDRFGAAVAFHGHAHTGSFRGATPGGVPVFNVSHVLLQQEGAGEMYFVYEIPLSPRGEPAAEREEAVVGQG
ncbi:metallophosphoesterase [soil metagenome]